MTRENEADLMRTLGSIAAGEFDAVVILTEKRSAGGEWQTMARFGGITEAGAKKLADRIFSAPPEARKQEVTK